jgi:hypothetical protein
MTLHTIAVPTVCLATSAVNDPGALLSLVVDYYRYRYNEPCDGCVAISDAVLPGIVYPQYYPY